MTQAVLEFLQGKKTYIVMALGVGGALVGFLNGELNSTQAVVAALGACGLGALRSGVTKAGA